MNEDIVAALARQISRRLDEVETSISDRLATLEEQATDYATLRATTHMDIRDVADKVCRARCQFLKMREAADLTAEVVMAGGGEQVAKFVASRYNEFRPEDFAS